MPRRPFLAALLTALVLSLQACASGRGSSALYSLEGPPLAIAGEQGAAEFTGQMERGCMLGQGQMELQSGELICAGVIKSAPNNAGHIAAMISCGEDNVLLLTFRALGPDQGIGLGRFFDKSGPKEEAHLIFYFHPWEEEARRRLEQEKDTLLGIISKKEKS